MASRNSIFVAHMISNSLKHTPPLGRLRGFATIRSGEHKNHIDLKMNGVVPVVDLGRIYSLIGELPAVNTRARLEAAMAAHRGQVLTAFREVEDQLSALRLLEGQAEAQGVERGASLGTRRRYLDHGPGPVRHPGDQCRWQLHLHA